MLCFSKVYRFGVSPQHVVPYLRRFATVVHQPRQDIQEIREMPSPHVTGQSGMTRTAHLLQI